MPIKIDLKAVEKGIALIERATASPIARMLLRSLLPRLGLTPEQIRELDGRHADYQARTARAKQRAGR